MSSATIQTLEDAIVASGEGWLIKHSSPQSEAMDHLRSLLASVNARAKERMGASAPSFEESSIVEEYLNHPSQVRGFFQSMGGSRTPDMLLMAWRIIQGMTIESVQCTYTRENSFGLRVVLESPYGVKDLPYESDKIDDFALFRHIGIMEYRGKPLFDGFYPLRVLGK